MPEGSANLKMHEVLKNSLAQRLNLSDEQWAFVFRHFKSKTTKRNELLLEKGRVSQYPVLCCEGLFEGVFN